MSSPGAQMGRSPPEPIAVVGMAMRFPGDSNSSAQFWDMLCKGRSASRPIPKERFNNEGYYHPDGARAGSINIQGSHFLNEDPLNFDAPFFSMTASEANGTDPQQRLMLEVAYEAMENAGIPTNTLVGSKTSCFVGCFTKDYESRAGRDPYGGPLYAATGNGQSMLSNRVSWFFDLRGPSMTIDTACSSSLYALHLACNSLKLGESEMAIVGGTNLIYDLSYMRDMVAMTFFSPDGVCHSFDHRANGYARGDGIGGVVLKPLSKALANGDTIRGVIRNTGLNQDGRTPGITMPSATAQADLIRSTYEAAGLDLDHTTYFEGHGTGTAIGDPIELSALGASFGKTRPAENPIYVGSVKTNIGHLEGCAGLAGFIKSVLVVENGQIPPLAGFEKANPRFKLEDWKVALPTELTRFPNPGVRRASINSFGYGGANAHVIVDDAYHYLKENGLVGNHSTKVFDQIAEYDSGIGSESSSPPSESDENGSLVTTPDDMDPSTGTSGHKLFVLSAADQAGLSRMSNAYTSFIEENLDLRKQFEEGPSVDWSRFIPDLAYTLSSRRSMLDHRSFVVAKTATGLSQQLEAGVPKMKRGAKNDNIAFIFTGQGAQWASMGKELVSHKIYRDSLMRAQVALETLGCPWSVTEEMFAPKDQSRIDHADFSQPLCTALQLALVDLLQSWGIKPKSVVGHSSGEIGAAYAAGYITHENAMKVAYFRGVFSAEIPTRQPVRKGAMMAVGLGSDGVQAYLEQVPEGSVVIACNNAPKSVTLSGDVEQIDKLEKLLKDDAIFARKLRVAVAYHSPHMKNIADDYLKSMGTIIPPSEPTGVTMFSSVTGEPIKSDALDPSYWVKNMLNTVRFAEAVKALISQPVGGKTRRKQVVQYSAMIECGPAEALKGPLVQILTAHDEKLVSSAPYTAMLARGADAELTALQAAGRLWCQGLSIDLQKVNFQDEKNRGRMSLSNLPPYPWNHSKSYGHESAWGRTYRHKEKPRTDLLGMRLVNQNPSEPRWHNFVRVSEQPWISDHKVTNVVLYPGAAMITMAIEAAKELVDLSRPFKAIEARNITFKNGLQVPSGDSAVETALHLRPCTSRLASNVSWSFQMFSQPEGEDWQENCTGYVSIIYDEDAEERAFRNQDWHSQTDTFSTIRKRATKKIAPSTFYRLFDRKMNLQYGPLHQNVTECYSGMDEGYGAVTIPDTKSVMPSQFEYPHLIHPSTLDSVFHMQALGYLHSLSGEESLVPISIESVYISADVANEPGAQLKGYSKGVQGNDGDTIGDIILSDDQWTAPKVMVKGFLSRDMSLKTASAAQDNSRPQKCTSLEWVELEPEKKEEVTVEVHETSAESEQITEEATDEDKAENAEGAELEEPRKLEDVPAEITLLLRDKPAASETKLAENLALYLPAKLESESLKMHTVTVSDLKPNGSVDLTDKTVICLLEAMTPTISRQNDEEFQMFKNLSSSVTSMLWLTRTGDAADELDLQFSTSTGLLRTVRVEKPMLKLPQLDLSPDSIISSEAVVDTVFKALSYSLFAGDGAVEQEFMEKDGKLFVPRLVTNESFQNELGRTDVQGDSTMKTLDSISTPIKALVGHDGDSIVWSPETDTSELGATEIEVRVTTAHVAPGKFVPGAFLGQDAVGIVQAMGSRVIGIAKGEKVVVCAPKALRTVVRVDQDMVKFLPESISDDVAACMPSALCKAQAVLSNTANIDSGEILLICGGPNNVEQALIRLGQRVGANIFVATETDAHRQVLAEKLDVPESHILGSFRKPSFQTSFRQATDGRGADVVVTMVPGDKASYSLLNIMADFGRFIGIGQRPQDANVPVPARNITMANVNLEHLRESAPVMLARTFSRSWDLMLSRAVGSIFPVETYSSAKCDEALAYLKSEECSGSVTIALDADQPVPVLAPAPKKLVLDPTATYILCGGLGGIGRSIADLMFAAGARNITFISRSGAKSDEAKQLLLSLQERGCNAKAIPCDAADADAVAQFAHRCAQNGEHIKGIVQCAMVLRDSMFDNMTYEQWTQSTNPKIRGSWNLHAHLPKDMDFFIMLSSMAGIIGNPGQANYSAAGTFQDALSVHRRANGLNSTTIDLGIVSDVGYIAENADQFERLSYLEDLFISERDLHLILGAAMLGQTRDGKEVPAQVVTGVGKELMAEGSIGSAMAQDLKYKHLQDAGDGSGKDSSEDELAKEGVSNAMSLKEATTVVEDVLLSQLAKSLMIEPEDVDLEKPMHSYGVDSLVAVEVKNMIFRKFKADVSVFDILSTMTMSKMAVKIVSKSKYSKSHVASSAQEEMAE